MGDAAVWFQQHAPDGTDPSVFYSTVLNPEGPQAHTMTSGVMTPTSPASDGLVPGAPPTAAGGGLGRPTPWVRIDQPDGSWVVYDDKGNIIEGGGGIGQNPSVPKTTTPPAMGTGGAPTLNPKDPASVDAWLAYMATQPGVNPSVRNDPGYWRGKILSGELGADPGYVLSKVMTPEGAPAGGGGFNYGSLGSFGDLTTPFTGSFDAPTFQAPGSFSAPQPFQAPAPFQPPTGLNFMNDPGYQERLKAFQSGIEHSAASHGDLLTGRTLLELGGKSQEFASNEYGNVFNRALQANQNAYDQAYRASDLGYNQAYRTNDLNFNQAFNSNQLGFNQALSKFGTNYGIFTDNQDRPFNKLYNLSNLGLNAASQYAGGLK